MELTLEGVLQSYGFFTINAIKNSETIEFLEKLTLLGVFVREEVRQVRRVRNSDSNFLTSALLLIRVGHHE
jgi:hypothetical protein